MDDFPRTRTGEKAQNLTEANHTDSSDLIRVGNLALIAAIESQDDIEDLDRRIYAAFK